MVTLPENPAAADLLVAKPFKDDARGGPGSMKTVDCVLRSGGEYGAGRRANTASARLAGLVGEDGAVSPGAPRRLAGFRSGHFDCRQSRGYGGGRGSGDHARRCPARQLAKQHHGEPTLDHLFPDVQHSY